MEKQSYIRQELRRHFQEWSIKTARLGAVLFLLLSPLDFISVPRRAVGFLGYRCAAAAVLLTCAAIARRARTHRLTQLWVFLGVVAAAITMEVMILDFGGHHSPYLIGMILLAVVVLGLIPAAAGFASLLAAAIFAVYLTPILAWDTVQDPGFFAVSTFLFLAILVVGIIIRWYNLESLVREISLRHDQMENQERFEVEIAQRTQAQTALETANRDLRGEIEQRRQSEDRLRLFAAAVESAAEGIYIIDLAGRILFCNQAAADQAGWSPEEMRSKSISDLYGRPEILEQVVLPAVRRNGFWAGEVPGFMRHEQSLSFWLTVSLVRDKEGGPSALVGITNDLSAQKKMEDDHIKTQKLESIGVLAGGLAHDFNNLLTIILGNLDLARLFAGGNPDILEALDHAAEASLRAGDLTRQLITFSKGGQPVKRIADIGELVRDTVVFAASGSNIASEFSIADGLPSVEFDEGQIRQVVHNLVQNAKEAMPGGGTIRVRVEQVFLPAGEIPSLSEGCYIRIDLADHGMGIARAHLHQIFDPYFSTKEMSAAKGRGLGLAVTYSIIRNHGGAITVVSRVGEGTTFSLYLPAIGEEQSETDEGPPSAAPAPPPPQPAATSAPAGEPSPSGAKQPARGRVLVMDDEPMVLEMAGAALRKMGYDAELCRDGAEAVVRYQIGLDSAKPFDAVILDLTVPGGMGGRDTFRRLREIDPHVRAAISSGYTNDPIATEYRAAGFRAFIAKPYTLRTLGELLAALV